MIINSDSRVINITDLDDNWVWTSLIPDLWGIQIQSITFTSVSDNEYIFIKNGTGGDPYIFPLAFVNEDESLTAYYNGKTLKPFFHYDSSVCSAGSIITIIRA